MKMMKSVKKQKQKQCIPELWDIINHSKMHVTGVTEERGGK